VQTTSARVDFYVLKKTDLVERMLFACRLSEKAYGLSTQVYTHTSSNEQADKLDQMLWTFRDASFVPHERVNAKQPPRAPVSIGTPEVYADNGELLINLCEVVPTFANGYSRIAEIVLADDKGRKAGRNRFRQYRELGLEPETHIIE
jgi:DNA polymerase III subunit chi